MSGLFKSPAQDPVFTLGDEDIGDLDPVVIFPNSNTAMKAAMPQSAPQRSSQGAALPVSSAAGAAQGPLNGSSGTAPVLRQNIDNAKGDGPMSHVHQSEAPSATSSSGPDVMSDAAIQSAKDPEKHGEHHLSSPAASHKTEPLHLPQSLEPMEIRSKDQSGSAPPVEGTLPDQDVANDETRHLDEDEEQRLAEVRNAVLTALFLK